MKKEVPLTWIRALEMESTDEGSPHTKSYHLGWIAGLEAAAQSVEQVSLIKIENPHMQVFIGQLMTGIAAHLRSMK